MIPDLSLLFISILLFSYQNMETNKFNLQLLMERLEDAHNHLVEAKDLKLEPMEFVLI